MPARVRRRCGEPRVRPRTRPPRSTPTGSHRLRMTRCRFPVARVRRRPMAVTIDAEVHTIRRFVLTIVLGGVGLAVGLIALAPQAKAVFGSSRAGASSGIAQLREL